MDAKDKEPWIGQFKNAKVGDKVWDMVKDRYIEIDKIKKNSDYPVCFYQGNTCTLDGRLRVVDANPRYFWLKFRIPKEAFTKPLPDLEIDTLLWVWRTFKDNGRLRYFKEFLNGQAYCYCDGASSITSDNNETFPCIKWELYEKGKE